MPKVALDVEWCSKTIILQGRRITDLHQKIQELREAFEYYVEYARHMEAPDGSNTSGSL